VARKSETSTKNRRQPLSVSIRPLTRRDWPIVEKLFGPNGACGGCWCMAWRVPKGGKEWRAAQGAVNRRRFRKLVEAGKVHGVLAFINKEPVGWCSFGPRRDFPKLLHARSLQTAWHEDTWSIVCFYIPSRWRGKMVASQLLEAATQRAFALGAKEIEGYPAVPYDPEKPMPAAFAWTGVPALFQSAGYKRRARPVQTQPVFLKTRLAGIRMESVDRGRG